MLMALFEPNKTATEGRRSCVEVPLLLCFVVSLRLTWIRNF